MDALGNELFYLNARGEAGSIQTFCFQGTKENFHRRVVVRISGVGHRRRNEVCLCQVKSSSSFVCFLATQTTSCCTSYSTTGASFFYCPLLGRPSTDVDGCIILKSSRIVEIIFQFNKNIGTFLKRFQSNW